MNKKLMNPLQPIEHKMYDNKGNFNTIPSVYTQINKVYSNEKFLQSSQPNDLDALFIRRETLRALFETRVFEVLNIETMNISNNLNFKINSFTSRAGFCNLWGNDIIDFLKDKFPCVFDVQWYFGLSKENLPTILFDICTLISVYLNNRLLGYISYSREELTQSLTDRIMECINEEVGNTFINLGKIFYSLWQEAIQIYCPAGYPGLGEKLMSPTEEEIQFAQKAVDSYIKPNNEIVDTYINQYNTGYSEGYKEGILLGQTLIEDKINHGNNSSVDIGFF